MTVPFLFRLHEEPHDFWRPTPHALKVFAEKYGFQVIELRKMGTMNDVIGTVLGTALDNLNYKPYQSWWGRVKLALRRRFLKKCIQFGLYWLQRNEFDEDFENDLLYVSNSVRLKRT